MENAVWVAWGWVGISAIGVFCEIFWVEVSFKLAVREIVVGMGVGLVI